MEGVGHPPAVTAKKRKRWVEGAVEREIIHGGTGERVALFHASAAFPLPVRGSQRSVQETER